MVMKFTENHTTPISIAGNKKENGYILFTLLLFGVLVMVLAMGTSVGMKSTLKKTGTYRTKDNAFNIAEAGKEHALSLLRQGLVNISTLNDSYRSMVSNTPFSNGNYSVDCKASPMRDTLILQSRGVSGDQNSGVEAIYRRYFPCMKYYKAVIMSRGADSLWGNMKIDGECYSTNTSDWWETPDITQPGVLGIFTCDTSYPEVKGSAAVTGFNLPLPTPKGVTPNTVIYGGDTTLLPRLPEILLGMDATELNKFKGGKASDLSGTLDDVFYYWDTCDVGTLSLSGSGIIICHNSSYTAVIPKLHGQFCGIIIADRIGKINGSADYFHAFGRFREKLFWKR
jgi:hypothetical protein